MVRGVVGRVCSHSALPLPDHGVHSPSSARQSFFSISPSTWRTPRPHRDVSQRGRETTASDARASAPSGHARAAGRGEGGGVGSRHGTVETADGGGRVCCRGGGFTAATGGGKMRWRTRRRKLVGEREQGRKQGGGGGLKVKVD